MNLKLKKSLISGIAGTFIMTIFGFLGPLIGLPKMNPASMLSSITGFPVIVGWIIHFSTGIIFAAAYVYIFLPKVKIGNKYIKGALYGMVVFLFAQIVMGMMTAIVGGMPEPGDSMMLMMVGSILGHLVFGIVVALIAKEQEL